MSLGVSNAIKYKLFTNFSTKNILGLNSLITMSDNALIHALDIFLDDPSFKTSWSKTALDYTTHLDEEIDQIVEAKSIEEYEAYIEEHGMPHSSERESDFIKEGTKKYYQEAHDMVVEREFEGLIENTYSMLHKLEAGYMGYKVYRCISVHSIKDFLDVLEKRSYVESYKGLGIYWAFKESAAECHWGGTTNKVTLHAEVPLSSVDVKGTIFALMSPSTGPEEWELKLKPGATLFLNHVDTKNNAGIGGRDYNYMPLVASINNNPIENYPDWYFDRLPESEIDAEGVQKKLKKIKDKKDTYGEDSLYEEYRLPGDVVDYGNDTYMHEFRTY